MASAKMLDAKPKLELPIIADDDFQYYPKPKELSSTTLTDKGVDANFKSRWGIWSKKRRADSFPFRDFVQKVFVKIGIRSHL